MIGIRIGELVGLPIGRGWWARVFFYFGSCAMDCQKRDVSTSAHSSEDFFQEIHSYVLMKYLFNKHVLANSLTSLN
jgi:hypothetical protein